MCRNVKDACVSAFYHNRSLPSLGYDGPFDHFAQCYLNGEVGCAAAPPPAGRVRRRSN